MSQVGWIKLMRSVIDHPCLQEHDALGLWARLIAMAARKPTTVRINGCTVRLECGQVALSVSSLVAKSRTMTRRRARTILALYQSNEMIKTVPAPGHAFSIITICNYEQYQFSEQDKGQAKDQAEPQERPTKGQRKAKLGPTEQERENLRRKESEEACISSSPPCARACETPPNDDDEVAPSLVIRLTKAASAKREQTHEFVRAWVRTTGSAGLVEGMIADALRRRTTDPIGYIGRSVRDHIATVDAKARASPQPNGTDDVHARWRKWAEETDAAEIDKCQTNQRVTH